MGAHRFGVKEAAIIDEFFLCPVELCEAQLKTTHHDPTERYRLATGNKKTYDKRDERMMLRNLRLHPRIKFRDRRKETGLDISNLTIKRIARKFALHHWRAKRRPELTE